MKKPTLARLALSLSLLVSLTGMAAHAADPSTQLTVSGQVLTSKTHDLSALKALPSVTQTDSFQSSSGSQTHTYTGPLLWSVLNDAGIKTDAKVKNDVLNKIVQVTGTDGYKVVYAAGELSPNFGNQAALLAWGETKAGTLAALTGDGFARSTAPLDVKGGRYVSNVQSIQVLTSASRQQAICDSCVSTSLTVSGDVLRAGTYDLAALKALSATTQTVGANTYVGVSLWDFLNTTVGLKTDLAIKNDVLGMYVVATGSDGYKAAFSLGELASGFGHQPDLLAYGVNGGDLGSNGFARIVVGHDLKQGRWVSNLVSLEVYHAQAVPEPETWALLGAGLSMLGLVIRRRAGQHTAASK